MIIINEDITDKQLQSSLKRIGFKEHPANTYSKSKLLGEGSYGKYLYKIKCFLASAVDDNNIYINQLIRLVKTEKTTMADIEDFELKSVPSSLNVRLIDGLDRMYRNDYGTNVLFYFSDGSYYKDRLDDYAIFSISVPETSENLNSVLKEILVDREKERMSFIVKVISNIDAGFTKKFKRGFDKPLAYSKKMRR